MFRANVDCVSDRAFQDLGVEELLAAVPANFQHVFLFVADSATFETAERPVLVVDLATERGRTFRVVPSETWGIENNLSVGNMDFAEFADQVDADGVFRGFPH